MTITQELLIGGLGIILFCFNELMVKIKVVFLIGFQLSCCKQGADQQFIHCVAVLKSYCFPEVDVYVVLSTVSSSIARSMVVCTAGVEGWVQGQVLHQVGCHIFNT